MMLIETVEDLRDLSGFIEEVELEIRGSFKLTAFRPKTKAKAPIRP